MAAKTEVDGAVREFHHPYQPYQIQLDLMTALYDCIQNRQIGIFESPTGTGKSLSLLCASLTWLRDHQLHGHVDAEGIDPDEPQWIIEQVQKEKRDDFLARKERIARHLAKIKDKEIAQKRRFDTGEPPRKRLKPDKATQTSEGVDEASFLLDDYDSDGEAAGASRQNTGGLSARTLDVLAQLGMVPIDAEDQAIEYFEGTKVFYSSRTHSQLSQLAAEVRKLKLPASTAGPDDHAQLSEDIKYLTLGSRKNLCINPKVNKLGSAVAINERCLQLQQSKNDSKGGCPYLPKPDNETLVHEFRDYALAKVRDIEDLAMLGKSTEVCPYYASRAAIRPSELVTLPYPLLLQKAAREALDLSLKDHVVIIDEAHNLMDAIAGIYSASVSLEQLKLARAQLGVYLQKFRNKVKGKNRVYLAQIIRIIDALTAFLSNRGAALPATGTTTVPELLVAKGADQIDLFKLSIYLRESKLARKVDGYVEFAADDTAVNERKTMMPVLSQIESFLQALTSPSAEGRFFYENEDGEPQLKYLLLDPTFHFKDVVDEARSVILIGGTMSPMNEFVQQLFPYAGKERIATLSCGHIIPDNNLLAWPVSRGKGSTELEFTFDKRTQPKVLDSLGKSLIALARTIPHGLVCFFPSYGYLDQVIRSWKSGAGSIWSELSSSKQIFTDSKETGKADGILQQYSEAVFRGSGALLMSVVGGKMSEGINFSDELGRGVVIIGLPFPNANSVEWKTKMEYIRQRTLSQGGTKAEGDTAARAVYENACMRAVNQSIGRAIRHRNDYATIFMFDRRYATSRIQEKLPDWIRKRLAAPAGDAAFDDIVEGVRKFFKQPRAASS